MSNARAIASVTAVLKYLLDNAMIEHHVSDIVEDGRVTVSALAPDRIKPGPNESAQLNLFLYHVVPNSGWRNVGLPSRDGGGERLTNPPLALDLYYLLTAYGKKDLEPETLLGYAMQTFHEIPILTRDAIRSVAAAAASDLADQAELIKLSPHTMSTEEISKLWSAFQTSYRPSAAYHASVVLIQSDQPTRSPLPVLTRGQGDAETGRDEGVVAQPHLVPPFPTLEEAVPPNAQPAVRMGEVLALRGHHLDGDQVVVRFTHVRSARKLELAASSGATATGFDVRIPPDPAPAGLDADSSEQPDKWQIGLYSVAAIIRRGGEQRLSNELPVTLAPRLSSPQAGPAGNEVEVTVKCSPKVWRGQRVTLVVGGCEVAAEPITEDKVEELKFKSSTFPSGEQWLRLRVDGVASILVDRSATPPVFYSDQKVTMP